VLNKDAARGQAIQTAPRGETRDRNWGRLPKPWDFTPFLVAKLKRLHGQWLFQEIEEWRAKGSEPALLIIGQAGVGKSTIVAALVHGQNEDLAKDSPNRQESPSRCSEEELRV